MSAIDYNFLINQIQRNLPTLPTIVNELTNILQNPDSSTFAVEDVMTSDQSMTMKILRVANTSFYRGGRDERVTDANEAIGSLGFEKFAMWFSPLLYSKCLRMKVLRTVFH